MEGSHMILRRALKMYCDRNEYAYFYDAKGCQLTDVAMDYLITSHNEHFSRFSADELKNIRMFSYNKTGYDCSGFIYAISGLGGSADDCYNQTLNKTDVVNGKAGSLLHKPGHVGIDIGYGYCLHMPIEGHTIELAKIQAVGFTESGEIPNYDYTEANNK